MNRTIAAGVIVILCIAGNFFSAAAGERMTPELLWKLGRVSGGNLSSDGTQMVYAVRRYDLEQNSGVTDLHVMNTADGSDRVVLESVKSAGDIQWMNAPSGERIVFIGTWDDDDRKTPQAWSLDPGGNQLQQLTRVEEGIANLKASPTGTHLAFTVDVKMDLTVNERFADLPKADARIIDSLMFRHWNAWHDYAYSHVHVAALNDRGEAGPPRDLMKGLTADCPLPPFGGAEQFNWSPDGTEIAYTAKVVVNWAESTDSDVYLVNIAEGPTRCITHGMDGYDTEPVYSPDGTMIAFHSMQRPGFEADRNRIMLFDRSTGQIRELTAGLDQTAHSATWMKDSAGLIFFSEYRGTNQIFRIDVASGAVAQLTRGQYNWGHVDVSPDGEWLVAGRQDMIRPTELGIVSIADGTFRQLTTVNDSIYQNLDLPTVKERWVRASDGELIHNWVIYPPDFDPDKKWPMLTYCQGGPQGQIGQWFSYRWNFHLMAAHGYVVTAVNRRGLPGFGQQWNDQISKDWGGQAMQDILASTDEMMLEPYVDRHRIGAIGASFGGYTVYWLMGNGQDRFQCMIAHCGVFNLESAYGSTEELFFVNWDLGGPYWRNRDLRKSYDRHSPHRFIGNWRTPLLVIHGEKDFRVPITQGIEAFTAAQVQGVPSRFLYFPNEGHWVLAPQNGVLWHRVFFDWLEQHLK